MTGGERKEGDGEKGEGERRKSDVRSAERMRKSHEAQIMNSTSLYQVWREYR